MREEELFLFIVYFILFALYLVFRCKKYFVKKSISGQVVFRIRPSGLKIFEILLYLALFIAVALFAIWGVKRFDTTTIIYVKIIQFIFFDSLILISMVFLCVPIKVCENGIIDSYDYVAWSSVKSYSRKTDTYVILNLDKLHVITDKLKIRHPAEYKDKVDLILSEHVK